jgi:hypothetical protein
VAVVIHNFVAGRPEGFDGTPTELLTELNTCTPEGVRKS